MIPRAEAVAKAEALVAQMTLEEKVAQLKYDAPAIPRLHVCAYNWWNEALHGVARAGTATVFPQAIGLAAIWDEDFMQQVAETIANEGRAKYNMQSAKGDHDIYKGLTFWSPNINLFRDPRWGRGQETYGEDPYLITRLGVRFIQGLQGSGKYLKTAACAKHFAVHSGPESVRHEFNAIASPKDLYETYLPAFEAAAKEAQVEGFMGAYNRVNGEPACGSKTLLTDILREKWGFEGYIVSDCWAIADFHTRHMVTATAPESAALALKNGCDINCGVTYLHLLNALQEGLISEEDITKACVHAFTTRFMLGLFADDNEYDAIPYIENDSDANNALALEAAQKSMVLLKNAGVLPLDESKIKTVAVIGPNADSIPALEGNYFGTSARYVTLLEGLRSYCESRGIRILYSVGCDKHQDRVLRLAQPADRMAEAKACAENADVIIACVGLDASLEGEEGDRGNQYFSGDKQDLLLPKPQQELMEMLAACGKPLITVLSAGSSLNVPQGDAQLLAWYPGQGGGTALAQILFGAVNPSGRLPVTFYRSINDLPPFTDYRMQNRTYRYYEGEPLYPFGYGLSYSQFSVRKAEYHSAQTNHTVSVAVVNSSHRDGDAIVQVYVHAVNSPDAPLHPALCGFARVHVNADSEEMVEIKLDRNTFTVVNDSGERLDCSGDFELYVGLCQPDLRSIALTGQRPIVLQVRK